MFTALGDNNPSDASTQTSYNLACFPLSLTCEKKWLALAVYLLINQLVQHMILRETLTKTST